MRLGLGLTLTGRQRPNPIKPFFNGMNTDAFTFTGGPNATLDNDGTLQTPNVDVPSITGGRFIDAATGFVDTDTEGADLYASTLVRGIKLYTDADPTEFKRYLSEPAATNYFLNSTAPVTQNITCTATTYTLSVHGAGTVTCAAGTATGSGFGVASAGTDITFEVTVGGTVSFTVADGPPDYVQVEVGAFATSPIETAGASVTRTKTLCSGTSAGVLRGNNMGIWGQVIPSAAGQSDSWLVSSYVDSTHYFAVYNIATAIQLIKYDGSIYFISASYSIAADTPFQYQAFQSSSDGMGVRVRAWTGSAWGSWSAWGTNANTSDAPIASTYEIGSRGGLSHFTGNCQMFRTFWHSDPKTYLENL